MTRLWEDIHVLTFFGRMTRADVLDMTKRERQWHVERVAKQHKDLYT